MRAHAFGPRVVQLAAQLAVQLAAQMAAQMAAQLLVEGVEFGAARRICPERRGRRSLFSSSKTEGFIKSENIMFKMSKMFAQFCAHCVVGFRATLAVRRADPNVKGFPSTGRVAISIFERKQHDLHGSKQLATVFSVHSFTSLFSAYCSIAPVSGAAPPGDSGGLAVRIVCKSLCL